jgi:hypothetical protein
MIAIITLIVLGTLALVLALLLGYWIFLWLASWVEWVVCYAKLLVGLDC